MQPKPYIPGLKPADPGPLSRFLPALEEGVIADWLTQLDKPSSWLLDPFGFSPRLVIEAALSGYRVLVTANNPVTRFLLEIFANPPSEAEFTAALADLGAIKKGDERLEHHFQSLYLTTCEKCNEEINASTFLWKKGDETPYARVYQCPHCGDSGERLSTEEDIERARKIAATDGLHRNRAFEKVVSLNDEDRIYAEEAIQHYLPRPLYVLTTIINRIDGLKLSEERKRALTALVLLACDAGNTIWAHPSERPRPKQLSTPNQFREHNLWMMLESGLSLWTGSGSTVPFEPWPKKIPESGGVCIYEGRLSKLAHEVKKEIPISAVIGAIPRPNQAFWTFSALWAGWLWGKEAAEPYKVALRRRRYDWAWNATALHAMFRHLNALLPDGVPMFGVMPEPEAPFMTAALTAAHAAGFKLESVALRTEHDPIQLTWKSSHIPKIENVDVEFIRKAMREYLSSRGEPAKYLHLHCAGLIACEEADALKQPNMEFDDSLRKTNELMETSLKDGKEFEHFSSGEGLDTGFWGLRPSTSLHSTQDESLADRIEIEIVTYLQKQAEALYLEIESDLYQHFPGLLTPSKGMIYAVLNSYAEKDNARWKLREEDLASARREEMNNMFDLLETLGRRLKYKTKREDKVLLWQEKNKTIRRFHVLASALVNRALETADEQTVIIIPGGRAALVAYKQERDPSLKTRLKNHPMVKYRLLRSLLEVKVLTRETFEEQIISDPVEASKGQMLMF